jgi:hypothetical protein
MLMEEMNECSEKEILIFQLSFAKQINVVSWSDVSEMGSHCCIYWECREMANKKRKPQKLLKYGTVT